MSEITLNDLPNEIIIKILRCLDQNNLRNATLTCKSWKYLIESSCRWSLTLYTRAVGKRPWIDLMMSSKRKFGLIKMNEMWPIETTEMLEIFQRHGVNVVKLWLTDCRIDCYIRFADLLKSMPNLKHVVIYNSSTLIDGTPPPEQYLPDVTKLKTLEIDRSDLGIVRFFRKAKLTTLKAVHFLDEDSLHGEFLEDFLKSQNTLTTLAFDSSLLNTTSTMFPAVTFQLKRLSLSDILLRGTTDHNSRMLQFMLSQANTLKELKLGCEYTPTVREMTLFLFGIPDIFFESVFENMTQLKTLHVMLHQIPRRKEFYERLEENRRITNLVLMGHEINHTLILRFFEKLPNIRSVTVPGWIDNQTCRRMAQCWNELESISMDVVHKNSFNGVRFPKLTTLRIQRLLGKIDWNKFTKKNYRLTKLTVEDVHHEMYLNEDDIDQIATNVRLQTLKLGGKFAANKRFFEIVWEKCLYLKVLDIHKSCISNDLKNKIDCDLLRLSEKIK